MDFTGRSLKGSVYVDPAGFAAETDLASWVQLSLEFTATLKPK
jgi:hypothetical protein